MVAGLTALLLVTLSAGLSTTTHQWFRAERNASDANDAKRAAVEKARDETNARNTAVNALEKERNARERTRRQLYVADMNVVCQALAENNFNRVEELLIENAIERDNVRLQGFEWFFSWQMCEEARRPTKLTLPYLAAPLAFSRDDRYLAVGLVERRVVVVDLESGKILRRFGPRDRMFHRANVIFCHNLF